MTAAALPVPRQTNPVRWLVATATLTITGYALGFQAPEWIAPVPRLLPLTSLVYKVVQMLFRLCISGPICAELSVILGLSVLAWWEARAAS